MVKKKQPEPAEIKLFYEAMQNVKPITHNKVKLQTRSIPVSLPPSENKEQTLNLHDNDYMESVGSEDYISYHHTSISNKILRKLRKGQYNVDAKLDLHGMTVAESRKAVEKFLLKSYSEGLQHVLIIHGKGHHTNMPVLKNKLNQWLRGVNMVLAFCSANVMHGSRGAIFILLKRNSEENHF